jgi:threonine synthase
MGTAGVLARYREFLPVSDATPSITLGEGDTPLVRSHRLEKDLGIGELYFKYEGSNPTGSFKDRGMVVAVAKAVESGCEALICASTGNTSASAAAYGARCGLSTVVVVPKGRVATGKMAQAVMYGARILLIQGTFDDALHVVRELATGTRVRLVNSVNPDRLEGQKTAAFEIIDDLGDAPDEVFIPVGNAGNITAYWRGFLEYQNLGRATRRPHMMGYQAAGAAPLVLGHPIENPETIATAIRIGNPASWPGAIGARDESGGSIDSVTDDEILAAYRSLAEHEGLFAEPASAASVAGLVKYARTHRRELENHRVVCVLTGTGLKDPDNAMSGLGDGAEEVAPDVDAMRTTLGWA